MRIVPATLFLLLIFSSLPAAAESLVRITQKREGLVHGTLIVPVTAGESIDRVELSINGVPFGEQRGRSVVFEVPVGKYIRRLRIRAVGYDVTGAIAGEDQMTVNDPRPPFRVLLHGPPVLPGEGLATLSATVMAPAGTELSGVDFFVGDRSIGHDADPPFEARFDAAAFGDPLYATATARTADGAEAHGVHFWGTTPRAEIEVAVQQIPLSISGAASVKPVRREELRLLDNGVERPIENVLHAGELPLHVVLLIDSSESMLRELPIVKDAAKEFARRLSGPNQKIAVVGFAQGTYWLTGFTSEMEGVERAVERLRARGQTHLYDAVIEMLFELQKHDGRRALVVLTDGVNQGGHFELDHVVHYARYSGVPVYPVVQNSLLARAIRFGIGGVQAQRFAAIARDSGATYFILRRPEELPRIYRAVAEELKDQYLIVFRSEATAVDRWHSLSLSSSRRGLTLRIPRGYFP
ncbi:MAG TPA: VWA domain-containing protein [Thermoanaerobaculia bacterium]|nr:VWA domain-containing protein [Thermoanaerobaculia bacterium]